MSNEHAQQIANAAVALDAATRHLRTFEANGARLATRDARKAVADAQLRLDAAIADAIEID